MNVRVKGVTASSGDFGDDSNPRTTTPPVTVGGGGIPPRPTLQSPVVVLTTTEAPCHGSGGYAGPSVGPETGRGRGGDDGESRI